MSNNDKQPHYLNLFRFHFPVTAVLSIGHRITGAVLALLIPVLVYLLALSLQGNKGFAAVTALFDATWVRVISVFLIWALVHHGLAGVRFLLLDLELGIARPTAKMTAWAVNIGGIVIFLLSAVILI